MPKVKDIPKIFHFIWVGGDVPEEHVDNIAAWKQAHPAYKAILWYDAANMLANTIHRRRMICEYDAPDVASVRAVQREADARFDRIWAAEVLGDA